MPTSHRRQAHKDALPPLTPHQREALYGMLLSDAHARQRADCHAALIEFRQSERQAPSSTTSLPFFVTGPGLPSRGTTRSRSGPRSTGKRPSRPSPTRP